MKALAQPVGGPILTWPFKILMVLASVGIAVLLYRFVFGLGSVTNLNDAYPWGLWIAFDVVTGTALACGGYAVAILVYVFNRGRYHPLVRPAVLTSALGYTLALIGVFIDLGRFWNVYTMAYLWNWNLSSVLLEVALCVMAYTLVLWIEMSPVFLEKWQHSSWPRLRRFSRAALPRLDRVLVLILALGLLLPTMHQSSLGSLLLLAKFKVHPLWHTPLLPLLFLTSCLAMGYAAVVFESILSAATFRRPRDTSLLTALSLPILVMLFVYLGIRFLDLFLRGRLPLAFSFDRYSLLFWVEALLFLGAGLTLLSRNLRSRPGHLFRAALLMMLAGALYRFDAFLVAYNPGQGWSYFPAVLEMLGTLGLVSLELMAYIAIVKRFPVLRARVPAVANA
jgi:Ni/Fe-hydrogenase subunit HybB-like protein